MRITVHLSTFERLNPCAYAILWLDRERRQWSRESHFGLDLPAWGVLETHGGATQICAQRGSAPLLSLEGLDLEDGDGPFEGETGSAQWRGKRHSAGHWYVQCIDEDTARAENSMFSDDSASPYSVASAQRS